MKVLHISTLSKGGAANAAIRLHHALLKQGVDSCFLTLAPQPNEIKNHLIFPVFSKYGFTLLKRVKNKLGIVPLKSQLRGGDLKKIPTKIECFSSPNTDFKLAEYINNELDVDIINLHWVANFLDYPEFFSDINKPIVWTLHDQNPFSSYWHYSNDNIENTNAREIHTAYLNTKKLGLQNSKSDISIVAPSEWLTNDSANSTLFNGLKHSTIRYGLDTTTFKPRIELPNSIDQSQIEKDAHLGLFICQSISNPRKGMVLLAQAIDMIVKKTPLQLIAIGQSNDAMKKLLPTNTIFTGEIADQNELAKLYSMAEFTIVPSIQDNLPNTLLESLCCGTPVIGTPAGGIPEIIKKNNYGIISDEISAQAISNAIFKFTTEEEKYDSTEISNLARIEFDESVQAIKYLDLYNEILSSSFKISAE